MVEQTDMSLFEIAEMLRERIFKRIATLSGEPRVPFDPTEDPVACHGGAAIAVKKGEILQVFVQEINPELEDYWADPRGRYAAYAAMKAITALQDGMRTVDTGEQFNFSGAVHRGGIPAFLTEYDAWVAIAFSGFDSWEDERIAEQVLQEFFHP